MADLSITAANVVPDDGYNYADGIAGETLTAGMPVYLKSSDTRYWKSDTNSATAEVRTVAGITLNGASAGQPVRVMSSGTVTIGATVAVGTIYVLSGTAGAIAPSTDLVSGWYTHILGIATTAAKIKLNLFTGSVAVP